jgi:hypothetical protein
LERGRRRGEMLFQTVLGGGVERGGCLTSVNLLSAQVITAAAAAAAARQPAGRSRDRRARQLLLLLLLLWLLLLLFVLLNLDNPVARPIQSGPEKTSSTSSCFGLSRFAWDGGILPTNAGLGWKRHRFWLDSLVLHAEMTVAAFIALGGLTSIFLQARKLEVVVELALLVRSLSVGR